jgi:hypothetical protein
MASRFLWGGLDQGEKDELMGMRAVALDDEQKAKVRFAAIWKIAKRGARAQETLLDLSKPELGSLPPWLRKQAKDAYDWVWKQMMAYKLGHGRLPTPKFSDDLVQSGSEASKPSE